MTPAELTCEIHPRLDVVSWDEWQRLFPDVPDPLDMVRLIQRCGIGGFAFHSILVRWQEQPILLLPLFETHYHFSTFIDSSARPSIDQAMRWSAGARSLRVLGVGFVQGAWSQIGVDRSVPPEMLVDAWNQALTALEALRAGLCAELTAFVNFTTTSGRMLPLKQLRGFTQLAAVPSGHALITPEAEEERIHSSLQRQIRDRKVELLRTRDASSWLETIYRFYLDTIRRSETIFGTQRQIYFEEVCKTVPGAEYCLYFVKDQLLAFRLVVVTPGCLIDKYFGMDPVRGRAHHLALVSWYENLLYCLEHQIPLYQARSTEEDIEAGFNTQSVPSTTLFRHHHPFAHQLLTLLGQRVCRASTQRLPKVHLGMDWKPVVDGCDRLSDALNPDAALAMNGHQRS